MTYRRVFLLTLAVVALTSFLTGGAAGHSKPRAARELLRLSGVVHMTESSCADQWLTLQVLNQPIGFCAREWQRIAVSTANVDDSQETLPRRLDVQGERKELARLEKASAKSAVVLLAEWRPGRRDLFLISLDVCDCQIGE